LTYFHIACFIISAVQSDFVVSVNINVLNWHRWSGTE